MAGCPAGRIATFGVTSALLQIVWQFLKTVIPSSNGRTLFLKKRNTGSIPVGKIFGGEVK